MAVLPQAQQHAVEHDVRSERVAQVRLVAGGDVFRIPRREVRPQDGVIGEPPAGQPLVEARLWRCSPGRHAEPAARPT